MSQRSEREAIGHVMTGVEMLCKALQDLDGFEDLVLKVNESTKEYRELMARLSQRHAILDDLESAALEFGATAANPKSISDNVQKSRTLQELALDLYKYDATIHPITQG